ncbi:MAG: glycosyltransferase [Acidobacteriota bacterium]|nr:glycosyltransferase [Acidobacteriota bacterium]
MNVTVIVVNWNRKPLLRACLASLHRQTNPAAETIVVDNGSNDGSAEMVVAEFPYCRVIQNSGNRGFCAGNNQGIHAANGQLIALLNNDAEADPNWLAALQGVFTNAPSIGMAASKILVYEDPRRIDKVGHLIYPDGQNRGRGTGALDEGQFDRVEEVLWPDGCAAMYRKDMLDRIGGFDEDFFAYGDDAELGLRARIAGWKCVYTPHAVVRHHRGSTLGLKSARRLRLIERNRVLLAVKLFPWSLLAVNKFYYFARLSAGALAALRGRGETALFPGLRGKWTVARALIQGDLEAIWMLPKMLRKRREIRKIRTLSGKEIRRLILAHRIPLRELATHAAV